MKFGRNIAVAAFLVVMGTLAAVASIFVIFFGLFGGGQPQCGAGGVQVTGNGVPQQIWNFLAAPPLNVPPAGDAGVLGNMQAENSFSTADNSGGMGIVQWIGDRRTAEIAMAAQNHLQPTDIRAQLLYLRAELMGAPGAAGDYRTALAAIKAATTPAEAAVAWQNDFEHPQVGPTEHTANRIAFAQFWYNKFNGGNVVLASYNPSSSSGGSSAPSTSYPLAVQGTIIATPADHQKRPLGNWQSDNAVDISAPVGTPVLAVADGTIIQTGGSPPVHGPGDIGGFSVTLKTSDNEYFYTHMIRGEVHVGQHVHAGEEIGLSGYANNVNHLHFASMNGDPRAALSSQPSIASSGGGCTAPTGNFPPGSVVFPFPPGVAVTTGWSQDQGVDISTIGGACGKAAPERAISDGIIVSKGISGFGPDAPVLQVTDGPLAGRYIYYGHAGDRQNSNGAGLPPNADVGSHVSAGQVITYTGCGDVGMSTGPHLEIGIFAKGASQNQLPGMNQTSAEMLQILTQAWKSQGSK